MYEKRSGITRKYCQRNQLLSFAYTFVIITFSELENCAFLEIGYSIILRVTVCGHVSDWESVVMTSTGQRCCLQVLFTAFTNEKCPIVGCICVTSCCYCYYCILSHNCLRTCISKNTIMTSASQYSPIICIYYRWYFKVKSQQ